MASEYQGADSDLRNLYRSGTGMTPRRLMVLIQGLLRIDSWLWREVMAADEHAEATAVRDQIREREAHYNKGG